MYGLTLWILVILLNSHLKLLFNWWSRRKQSSSIVCHFFQIWFTHLRYLRYLYIYWSIFITHLLSSSSIFDLYLFLDVSKKTRFWKVFYFKYVWKCLYNVQYFVVKDFSTYNFLWICAKNFLKMFFFYRLTCGDRNFLVWPFFINCWWNYLMYISLLLFTWSLYYYPMFLKNF